MGKALLELARIQMSINKGFNIPREDMMMIGFLAADRIKVRTRLGNNRFRSPLKALSPGYKIYRQKYPYLYDQTTPSKSNLTLTGQLLDSMDVKSDKPNSFTIFFKENRHYLTSNSIGASNVTNSDIVSHQLKQGRDFFGFSDAELSFISTLMRQYFKENFKL